MKKGLKIGLGLLAVTATTLAIVYALRTNRDKASAEIAKELVAVPFTVTAAYVKQETFKASLSLRGTVEPHLTATIFSEADGKIISLNINKGVRITKGQILAVIDGKIRAANVQLNTIGYNKAVAENEKANTDYSRMKALFAENNATKAELENAELQLKAATAALSSFDQQVFISKQQLQQTIIKAAFSGVLVDKKANTGDYVQPGTPLGVAVDLDRVIIKVFVPENFITQLNIGTSVLMTADVFPNAEFTGKVKTIVPVASEAKSFPVEIELKNTQKNKLMAGFSMTARFSPNTAAIAFVIPRTALVGGMENPFVYVIDDKKKPIKKVVQVGNAHGTDIAILGGLQVGEIVITSGQSNIEAGKILKDYTITNK
jgi:membrane fusion protein, multidrug efflux system